MLIVLSSGCIDWWYWRYFVDDIPVRGFVGRLDETGIFPHKHGIFLYTHLTFNIEYNGDQVLTELFISAHSTALLYWHEMFILYW